MYSLLLETYIKDTAQKQHLFHAIENIPCIARKAEWAMKWITRCAPPAAQPPGTESCGRTPLRVAQLGCCCSCCCCCCSRKNDFQ